MATVIYCDDPFHAHRQRAVVVKKRRSIGALAPRTRSPVICLRNGQAVLRGQRNHGWRVRAQPNDVIVFIVLPRGGGGGGKNPLRIVALIVIVVASFYTGGAVGAAYGAGWGAAASAAVSIAGSALVNAIIPPPKPPAPLQLADLSQSSPTYNLQAQGNSARIGGAIPVLYGSHRLFPDYASQPFVEYDDNEQYLYQLFCITQGACEISSIKIEDTPIATYPDVVYQIVEPGQAVTLFPTNVDYSTEVSGQTLASGTTTTVPGYFENVYRPGYWEHGGDTWIESGYYSVWRPATIKSYAPGAWTGYFAANAATTTASAIGIDIVMPRGSYYGNDDGGLDAKTFKWTVELQPIDDLGNPNGSTITKAETWSGKTTTPQRLSYRYTVPTARYRVRVRREDTEDTSSRAGHELAWGGLRAYLVGSNNYGAVTLLAVKARASNSLSQTSSRKINVIATRKLPILQSNGSFGAAATTQNPADIIADIWRATYGEGLPDSRIDLAGLAALRTVWASRGDTFNAVFDQSTTVEDAIKQVTRAGRAMAFRQGGVARVVRDAPSSISAAMFSQRNIVKQSFRVNFSLPSEDNPDAVEVTYLDGSVWQELTVLCYLPGTTPANPAKVKLFGVTNRSQAWREGMYMVACNRYRRRFPTFTTEMEGYIPTILDPIIIQHDMPRWGQSGELVAYNAATRTITTNEPLDFSAGGAHAISFRRRNGTESDVFTVTAGATDTQAVLSTALNFTPDMGGDRERTHFVFGPSNQQKIRARVQSLRPQSRETVEISCVVESDYVHTADTGVAPSQTAWQFPANINQFGKTDGAGLPADLAADSGTQWLNISNDGVVITRVKLTWAPPTNPFAEFADIQYQLTSATAWQNAPTAIAANSEAFLLGLEDGKTYNIRLRYRTGLGVVGDYTTVTHTVVGKTAPPDNVIGLQIAITDNGVLATWAKNDEKDWAFTEIRVGLDWATSTLIVRSKSTHHNLGWLSAGTHTYQARHVDTTGHYSTDAAITTITIAAPTAPQALSLVVGNASVIARWDESAPTVGQLPVSAIELSWSSTFLPKLDVTQSTTTTFDWLPTGTHTLYAHFRDVAGNIGAVSEITLIVKVPDAPQEMALNFGTASLEATWKPPVVTAEHIPLDRVELSWTSDFASVIDGKKSTTATFGWLPTGTHTLYARYIDVAGNVGLVNSTALQVINPAQVTMTSVETQVNAVTLRWADAKTSQPIKKYYYHFGEAGQSFAQTLFYGSAGSDGRSDIIFFRASGNKVIYIVAEDVAGNQSPPRQINVSITMPNNFVLSTEYYEDWQSTELTNGTIIGGATGTIILPSNPTRQWGQRLSNYGWTTAQQKVDAGYPIVTQPVPTSGKHIERHDTGKVIATSVVSATPAIINRYAGATETIRIRVSNGDTDTAWQPWLTGDSISASNFRYIEVEFSVASDGKGWVELDDLYVKAEVQEVSETTTLALNASDTNGTPFVCTKNFLDIRVAIATPLGSANIQKINCIPDDSTQPVKVFVQAWDANNYRTSGTVSLFISGV